MADRQEKGAVGAGLLTAGSAGVPVLLPFTGAFQIGYGLGMIGKQLASISSEDRDFTTAVKLEEPKIAELAFADSVPPSIADPANGAVKGIASFVGSIRAFETARNRMDTARGAGDHRAAEGQKAAVSSFFVSARRKLKAVSCQLEDLAEALDGHPDGAATLAVPKLHKKIQKELAENGFPEDEQPLIEQFQMTEREQAAFIEKLAGISSEEAKAFYGSRITLQALIRELSLNSREIAGSLDAELNLTLFGSLFVASLGNIKLPSKIEARVAGEIQAAVMRGLAEVDFKGDVHARFPGLGDGRFPFPPHTLGIWIGPDEITSPEATGNAGTGPRSNLGGIPQPGRGD